MRVRQFGRELTGRPCPPGIPPIELSAAEAARIERLTRNYAAGLLTRARLQALAT